LAARGTPRPTEVPIGNKSHHKLRSKKKKVGKTHHRKSQTVNKGSKKRVIKTNCRAPAKKRARGPDCPPKR